ncbi:MAG: carbohydrate deacetylase [Anaerolineae bacterium]
MSKSLIINADDYGFTPGVSRGIRQAHLDGIVTSTTAMMNMPGAESALRDAMALTPNLGLGVHLTLTAGRPLLSADKVRTLVDAQGQFLRPAGLAARGATIDLEHVRAEWRAQIDLFCAAVGHAPDHLDGHHHTPYELPGVFPIMLELAAAYGCPVRSPLPDVDGDSSGGDAARAALLAQARALMETHRVRHPDHMSTAFYNETATVDHLLHILRNLKAGVTEIMTHPGYVDEVLLSISSYTHPREREIQVLTDPVVKAALQELDIRLVNFGNLP